MKKLALLMGSLLVVAATASAKEVVAAPVVVEESKEVVVAPVVVIEEVPTWRPSGFADISYKYFGQNEYDSADFGRLQFEGNLNMTPKQSLNWRVRNYNAFQHYNELKNEDFYSVGDYGDYSDLRLRYHYKNGELGNTKISLTQRLEYRNFEGQGSFIETQLDDQGDPIDAFRYGSNSQRIEYMALFQFSPYFDWTPEWFKNNNFTIAPRYRYSWANNNGDYANILGIDVYTGFVMPYGFSTEFKFYPAYVDNNQDDSNWEFAVEAYLYWNYDLVKEGPWTLSANFEGGMDPWKTINQKFDKLGDESTYSAYALPSLRVDYQATDFVKVYAEVGAEYRNWDYTKTKSAREWSWMPQATIGARTTF